jgi:D-alanine-D-alanine ligase
MHDYLVPPGDATKVPDKKYVEWKTEFDVLSGLDELQHAVHKLGVGRDLAVVREAIDGFRPDIVFNLLESFYEIPSYDHYVPGYLELLRQPYTGCNPRGLMLARDKALSKKLLAYHRIPSPAFAVFGRGKPVRRPARLKFPLMVKSLTADGSIGLAQASIVQNDAKLEDRVRYIQTTFETDVIAEEYILGREVYVPILGNRRLTTLPVMELEFGRLAEGSQPIATSKVKWDWKYQEARGIELKFPTDLGDELARRIVRTSKRVFRALGLSGYARIDLRVTEDGRVFVIEANPNADLGYGEELHESAEAAGFTYPRLLQRILNLGLAYQAEWRQAI